MGFAFVRPTDMSVLSSTGRVLDVGCGDGVTARGLGLTSAVGMDLNFGSLSFLARRGGSRIVQGSAVVLPFGSSTFELVVAFDLVHHLPNEDLDRFLSEVVRVLRPEGRFVGWWMSSPPHHAPGAPDAPRFTRDAQAFADAASRAGLVTAPLELSVLHGTSSSTIGVSGCRIKPDMGEV